MKKALRETQTLRAGCSKAGPTADPFPGAQDGQNLISWRCSLPSPTDQVWWKSMHAISSYCGNRHRPPAVRHRQDRLQYTVPLNLARSVKKANERKTSIVTVCCTSRHHSQTPILQGVGKFCDFRLTSQFISQTIQGRLMVATER